MFQKRVHKQRAVGLMFLHPLFSFPSVVDRQLLHSQTTDLNVLALFLPPVSVFCKTGCNSDFLISIGLSILGWIPGVIHAW